MKVSIVELRYHMNDVIKALNRNETIDIFYRNKKIGILQSIKKQSLKKVEDHLFYGMMKNNVLSVIHHNKSVEV